jgi:trk system potassium uptake protein TrkH
MNPKRISRLLGVVMGVLACAMSSGVLMSLLYSDDQSLWAFIASCLLTGVVGAGFWLYGRGQGRSPKSRRSNADELLQPREAIVVVTLSWLLMGIFGGIPYLFDGSMTSFEDAFFESCAGFTTTGSTILPEIHQTLSKAGHFWRCLTHWMGGMGIVVLFVAIFPELGVGGKHLFKNEVSGPITEGLRPKIRETSAALWRVYIGLTIANGLALWGLGGMDWFEATVHAFSTMASGGFSTRNGSMGEFGSPMIDWISVVFMLAAGVNFSLYYVSLFQGQLKQALRDRELWLYLGIVIGAVLMISGSVWLDADRLMARETHPAGADYHSFLTALRYGAFQTVSAITTTGLGTDNFDDWSEFCRMLLVMLMFIGGCAGSTAGGLKVFRVLVLFKVMGIEIYRAFRPAAVKALRVGSSVIPEQTVHTIVVFTVLFFMIFAGATLYVCAMGHDLITSSTAVIASITSVGPGLGKVNGASNYGFFEPSVKVLLSMCMILGRLELFTVLMLLMPSFWRR